MEKRSPHFALERIHRLVREGAYVVTMAAQRSADRDFALSTSEDIAAQVLKLTHQGFYKSMTTYHDSRVWQDVYHAEIEGIAAYIKLQIVAEVEAVVISFKERDA
jgi:motility quorum-sensing regulator / GCU-specific mRNA interferase toxin